MLVLGTGEFAYLPFQLAEHLQDMGLDVRYQSTTRSPIMPGLAIQERLVFQDNYQDGILNYVYNVRRDDYDHIIIVHETPVETLDKVLTEPLGAITLYMADGHCPDQKRLILDTLRRATARCRPVCTKENEMNPIVSRSRWQRRVRNIRKFRKYVGDETVLGSVCELDDNGKPRSYQSSAQKAYLSWLLNSTTVVPITGAHARPIAA